MAREATHQIYNQNKTSSDSPFKSKLLKHLKSILTFENFEHKDTIKTEQSLISLQI